MKHVEKSRHRRVYSTKRETATILYKHRGSFGEDRSDELTSLEIIACKMHLHPPHPRINVKGNDIETSGAPLFD